MKTFEVTTSLTWSAVSRACEYSIALLGDLVVNHVDGSCNDSLQIKHS